MCLVPVRGRGKEASRARRRAARPGGQGACGASRGAPRSPAQLVAADPIRSVTPRPTWEPAAAPCSVPRTAASAAAANPARAGELPFHILLGLFFPSCLILSDGIRSPGGCPWLEARRGQRGAPRPAGPAQPSPALPSPRARRWRAAGAAQAPQPPPAGAGCFIVRK